jgi:hypothetical protein
MPKRNSQPGPLAPGTSPEGPVHFRPSGPSVLGALCFQRSLFSALSIPSAFYSKRFGFSLLSTFSSRPSALADEPAKAGNQPGQAS